MKNNITIRIMTDSDSETVLEIYRMGIETRNATFETIVPDWDEWDMKKPEDSLERTLNQLILFILRSTD